MVKRDKSPPIDEDAKYLVVWQPYPLNANWELDEPCLSFAYWIAAVLDSYQPVLAIHHKPSARSTVILEIEKKYNTDKLLGEHRWKEILRKPSPQDKGRVSRIYYSLYTTMRDAQKDGWKRIHIERAWFQAWDVNKGPFKNPYPDTHWCPPLIEDFTSKPIARPLPVSVKPPPPPTPALVPGSSRWVEAQKVPQPTTQEFKGAWATRKATNTNGNRGPAPESSGSRRGRRPAAAAVLPAQPANQPRSTTNPWNQQRSPADGTSVGSSPSPLSSSPLPSVAASLPSSGPRTPTSPWGSINPAVKAPTVLRTISASTVPSGSYPAAPPGLTRQAPPRTAAAAASAQETTTVSQLERALSAIPPPSKSWADDFDDELQDDGDEVYLPPPEELDSDDEDDPANLAVAYLPPRQQLSVQAETSNDQANQQQESTEKFDWDFLPTIPRSPKHGRPLCPEHGRQCNPGICIAASKLKRLQNQKKPPRRQKKEQKEKDKDEKGSTGPDSDDGDDSDSDDREGFKGATTRRNPNHSGRPPYRGRRRGRGSASAR